MAATTPTGAGRTQLPVARVGPGSCCGPQPLGLGGEVVHHLGRAGHLGPRLGQRLAHLGGGPARPAARPARRRPGRRRPPSARPRSSGARAAQAGQAASGGRARRGRRPRAVAAATSARSSPSPGARTAIHSAVSTAPAAGDQRRAAGRSRSARRAAPDPGDLADAPGRARSRATLWISCWARRRASGRRRPRPRAGGRRGARSGPRPDSQTGEGDPVAVGARGPSG